MSKGKEDWLITTYGGSKKNGVCMVISRSLYIRVRSLTFSQGDSGGPLTYQNGQHTLIGISSHVATKKNGKFSVCTGQYSHFTSVSHYRDWIDDKMKASKFCKDDRMIFF